MPEYLLPGIFLEEIDRGVRMISGVSSSQVVYLVPSTGLFASARPGKRRRLHSYERLRFRVKWQGRYVAGIDALGAIGWSTDVVEYREGTEPSTAHKIPGRVKYSSITLKRGVVSDREFEEWLDQARTQAGKPAGTVDFRRDVRIELLDDAGRVVVAYDLFRCWASEVQVLPALDADAATVVQLIRLEHEGWKRDTVIPPTTSGLGKRRRSRRRTTRR